MPSISPTTSSDKEIEKGFDPWMIARRSRRRQFTHSMIAGEQLLADFRPTKSANRFQLLEMAGDTEVERAVVCQSANPTSASNAVPNQHPPQAMAVEYSRSKAAERYCSHSVPMADEATSHHTLERKHRDASGKPTLAVETDLISGEGDRVVAKMVNTIRGR